VVLGAFYRARKGGEWTSDDVRWWSSLKSSVTRMGEGETEGRHHYERGKEWGGAGSGKGATWEAIWRPEVWGGSGALGRRWTREEVDDCLVGLCWPRG
jgi:hypothetical protein